MRTILASTRAMLDELYLAPQDWVFVVPIITSAVTGAGPDSLGRRADGNARSPFEVMTGLLPARLVLRIFPANLRISKAQTVAHAQTAQSLSITERQAALNQMHKEVKRSVSFRRERAITVQNSARTLSAHLLVLATLC